jgi:hypothetical protein
MSLRDRDQMNVLGSPFVAPKLPGTKRRANFVLKTK